MTAPTHDHGGTAWRALDAAVVLACVALVGVVLAMVIANRRAGRGGPAGPALPHTGPLVDIDALRASVDRDATEAPAEAGEATPVAKPPRRARKSTATTDPDPTEG